MVLILIILREAAKQSGNRYQRKSGASELPACHGSASARRAEAAVLSWMKELVSHGTPVYKIVGAARSRFEPP